MIKIKDCVRFKLINMFTETTVDTIIFIKIKRVFKPFKYEN